MTRSISASVGAKGAANRVNDVITVQAGLNDVSSSDGGPTTSLNVDGVCGFKTIAAIQKFQLHHFGWPGADGRVDPNGQTLRKLNELARPLPSGGEGTCVLHDPCPPDVRAQASAFSILPDFEAGTARTASNVRATSDVLPPPDTQIMQKAFQDSRNTLKLASDALQSLLNGIDNESVRPLNEFQKRVLISVGRWLKVKTGKGAAERRKLKEVTLKAKELIDRNFGVRTSSNTAPGFRRVRANFHAQTTGNPDGGVDCGTPFFTQDGPNCRRDVITHEFFHFVGVHHGGGAPQDATPRASILTPEQALDSADNLAQLVSEIINGRTDACLRQGD